MKEEFRMIYLPYVIEKQASGKFVVLNRYYKPLGMDQSVGWVDYTPYEVKMWIKETIYLYNDGSVPTRSVENWEEYQKKLSDIAKLKVQL